MLAALKDEDGGGWCLDGWCTPGRKPSRSGFDVNKRVRFKRVMSLVNGVKLTHQSELLLLRNHQNNNNKKKLESE